MTTIAMIIYILKKETKLLGKRYDKEYETDLTKGLGWMVWSYLWWADCIVSMILSFFKDDWSFTNMFFLWIGTTLLFSALVAAWSVIRKERIDVMYSTNKVHTPDEIFEAIGAKVKSKIKDEKSAYTNYMVAYQGGRFIFTFTEDSRWIDIVHFSFEKCKYEYINKLTLEINSLNSQQEGWSCYFDICSGEETFLTVSLTCRFVLNGSLKQVKESLEEILEQDFFIAREFSRRLQEKISKQDEMDDEFFTNELFNNKIDYIRTLKETNHLDGLQEEFTDSSALSIDTLVKYFDNVSFGCLLNMRIIRGNHLEEIIDLVEIQNFDIREYIKKQPDAKTIRSISIIISFEYQDLFINLTKAIGSTEKSLFFVVNIMRSGNKLDDCMKNSFAAYSRTLLEVRLTDAEQDYWEAKYMIDEAMNKAENNLTDEERLVLANIQPTIQQDLYWGKKYYNNKCYFQALYHFNRVFRYIRYNCNSWNENMRDLYVKITSYIGFIYTDLRMYDRAFYYLWQSQSEGDINGTYEFVNCLCNMKDVGAKDYISAKAKEITELMKKWGEDNESLSSFYNFLRRRYVFVLINRGEFYEAEEIINKMIVNEQDLEFAKGELEYINAIKEKRKSNNQEKNDDKVF